MRSPAPRPGSPPSGPRRRTSSGCAASATRSRAPTAPGPRRRADGQFHIEVAATAQSTRLYRAEVSLQAEVGTLLWLAFGDDESHRGTVRSCLTVVDAVARADGEAARTAAEERVADSTARLIDLRLAMEH